MHSPQLLYLYVQYRDGVVVHSEIVSVVLLIIILALVILMMEMRLAVALSLPSLVSLFLPLSFVFSSLPLSPSLPSLHLLSLRW